MKPIAISDPSSWKIQDEEVVKKVLAGEKELYELLMRRNNQMLYRVIAGYINEVEDIADVMQDTYLKAYEKLYQFKFNSSFSTWLVRIGINEALRYLRNQKKQMTLNRISEGLQNKVLMILAGDKQNPEDAIIQREAKQLLEKAVMKLEPKYRIVYILREVEGLSMRDVADCLELSESNVKVRLHRAKKKIRKHLLRIASDTDILEFGNANCDAIVEKVLTLL